MIRCTTLLAAATLAGMSVPAMGQAGYDPGLPPPLPDDYAAGNWEGQWQGSWDDAQTWRGVWYGTYTGLDGYPVEAEYRGTFIGVTRFVSDGGQVLYRDHDRGWREDQAEGWDDHRRGARPHGRGMPAPAHGARIGYPPDQRAAWLEDCRAAYYDGAGRRRGEIVGGVLGAVAGGVAGNRIADGAGLGGTLIGAGVGGLAGAAIGGAIGGERDRDRLDECEAYLLRYEQSFAGGQGAHGYGYGPVMWVKVPIIRKRSDCNCERMVEEWIEEEEIAPAPAPVKRVRIRQPAPVKTKTVRYAK